MMYDMNRNFNEIAGKTEAVSQNLSLNHQDHPRRDHEDADRIDNLLRLIGEFLKKRRDRVIPTESEKS